MSSIQQMKRVSIGQFGLALSVSFAVTYVLCVVLGIFWPDWEFHRPWLQFFPGFEWLTVKGFFIGLAESVAYGWYAAFLFGGLFNLFAAEQKKTH